jgi:hypothetical protein
MLGSFIEYDMSFEESGIMSVARILVQLDLQLGLLHELVIELSSRYFVQTLDYEGIPFRCHRCHVYGHRVSDCTLTFKGKSCFIKGDVHPMKHARPSSDVRLEDGGFEVVTEVLTPKKEILTFPTLPVEKGTTPLIVDWKSLLF